MKLIPDLQGAAQLRPAAHRLAHDVRDVLHDALGGEDALGRAGGAGRGVGRAVGLADVVVDVVVLSRGP